MLLYGDEIGMRGTDAQRGFEDVWSDREPMPWDPSTWDHDVLQTTRDVLSLRQRLEVLRLDNDPNAPERGQIEFLMEGGV